jgi:DNA invertase Pin-like site-specific DNA recombinase
MNLVAVYARFSIDKQDPRSIEDQIRRCRALAEQRGWLVIGTYEDAAQSGTHIDRVNLQRLLRDADHHHFRYVIVDDLSRLSRDLGATWRLIYEDLAAAGMHLVDCSTGRASNEPGARPRDRWQGALKRSVHRTDPTSDSPWPGGQGDRRVRHRWAHVWFQDGP